MPWPKVAFRPFRQRCAAARADPAQYRSGSVRGHRLLVVYRCGARAARRGRGSAGLHGVHGQRAPLSGHAVWRDSDVGQLADNARRTESQRRCLRIRPRHQPDMSVYAMRMAAVFTISVSTAARRTAALPRWVSYLGYLIALVLLVAAGEHRWTQLVFPSWVLLVSLVILFVRPPNRVRGVEVGSQRRHRDRSAMSQP